MLRFDDRETRPSRRAADKLALVRDIWEAWLERLPVMYTPGENITVDKRLIPFRSRCAFRQYMPRKPGKYGLKLWVASDSASSYAYNVQIYTDKPSNEPAEAKLGMRVVLDLMVGLTSRTVVCDNFFTSYELGQELLKRKLTMLGTIRKNRGELPSALLSRKGSPVHSSTFAHTDNTTVVSYLAKKNKNVLLMSTAHREARISCRADGKPQIILEYNKTKGGVDTLDMCTAKYSCQRRTCRWPVAIFFNMIDIAAYNAFVIWGELNPTWKQGRRQYRRLFLGELGKALVTPAIEKRERLPRSSSAAAIVKATRVLASTSAEGTVQNGGGGGWQRAVRLVLSGF
nr:piggyBac transposable element-derived protein 4-like [Paramormyrops kingsleyae]